MIVTDDVVEVDPTLVGAPIVVEAAPLPPPPTRAPTPLPLSGMQGESGSRGANRELATGSTALPREAAAIAETGGGAPGAPASPAAAPLPPFPQSQLPPQLTPELRAQFLPDLDRAHATNNAVTQREHAASARVVTETPVVPRGRRVSPVFFVGGAAAAAIVIAVVIFATRGGGGGAGDRDKAGGGEPETAGAATTTSGPKVAAAGLAGEGDDTERPDPTASTDGAVTTDPSAKHAAASSTPPAIPGTAADATDGAATSAAAATTTSDPPTPTAGATPAARPAPVKRLGGKQVVLEYDNTAPKETPKKPATPNAKSDETTLVAAARNAYLSGNKKLFAGDANGAIKLYQQALATYPGYVAGYRGLGLAYAQKGDKPNALKAFRTYINAVPAAKDVALIKKRIAALQN